MSASNEQLAMRFVELLAQSATRNGQSASRWTAMNPAWRRVFMETIPAFLDEVSHQSIPVGHIDERREDEQIRQLCENLTARQRLKTYRQLYALDCRIDGVDRAIEKLKRSSG
jgi:hypothetical protein